MCAIPLPAIDRSIERSLHTCCTPLPAVDQSFESSLHTRCRRARYLDTRVRYLLPAADQSFERSLHKPCRRAPSYSDTRVLYPLTSRRPVVRTLSPYALNARPPLLGHACALSLYQPSISRLKAHFIRVAGARATWTRVCAISYQPSTSRSSAPRLQGKGCINK